MLPPLPPPKTTVGELFRKSLEHELRRASILGPSFLGHKDAVAADRALAIAVQNALDHLAEKLARELKVSGLLLPSEPEEKA